MTRLDDAKQILKAFNLPRQQTNDNAAYTLLAFANIGPRTPWKKAEARRLNPHDVLQFIRLAHKKPYAENTRETIRRQAIHQFVQAAILVRNPDAPDLPTNSPRTHYALSSEALSVIQKFGTRGFGSAMAAFLLASDGGLAERHAKRRKLAHIPVVLPDGEEIELSPGAHNELQRLVLTEFLPRFAPAAKLLYLGDTDTKHLVFDKPSLRELGVTITKHGKLPDIVAHDVERHWLFLIEAVTSHGPVSAKRHFELEQEFVALKAGRVYVSAFLDFREFKRHADSIAWETEVWIADAPSHLLHYNGDRFFGPR